MKRSTALGLLLLCALLWSTGGLLIKSVDWTPMGIAGMRSAIATVVIGLFFRPLRINFSRAQIGGAIAYAATVVLFVLATRMTTAANAILLQYTGPIYVALFGPWFLGERSTRLDWIVIFIALFGMTLFFFDKLSADHLWGNIVALLSGVSFGWMTLFLRKQRSGSPIGSVVLGNAMAALFCIPFMSGPMPSLNGWGLLFLLGVFQLALPYVLYVKALSHVVAIEAILIPIIEPILNPFWVLLFVGEVPGPMSLFGGSLILFAVGLRAMAPMIRRRIQSSY